MWHWYVTAFHSKIGALFEELVADHPDYNLVYHTGLIKTIDLFYTQTLESIQGSGARVIFVAANSPQVANLSCCAMHHSTTWCTQTIIADYLVSFIEGEGICDTVTLQKAINGSITSYFKIGVSNSKILVSNKTQQSYQEELERVRLDYSQYTPINGDSLYGGLLYDQIWAFALALQAALPELNRLNYSIADYAGIWITSHHQYTGGEAGRS